MKLKTLCGIIFALSSVLISPLHDQNAPKDWQFETGLPATEARLQWQKLTGGIELARGKKMEFFPKPNDRLTTDENDPYDLTDGTLSSRADDRVWFNKDAVGWYGGLGTSSGILLMVDLGQSQPVGQIAIRVLGGSEQASLSLPGAFEFLASEDGKKYFQLQKTVQLNEAEKNQADNKSGLYISEEGKAFMAPIVCREAVQARYIAIRVYPRNSLFTDQISIQKADPQMSVKHAEDFPHAEVYTDGMVIMPRHKPMVITTNIATPNWLTVIDNSGLDLKKANGGFRLELPKSLHILPNIGLPHKDITPANSDTNIYEYQYDGKNRSGSIGPLWIVSDEKSTIPASSTVKITAFLDGKDSHTTTTLLRLVQIPETQPIKGLDVSLAWNFDGTQQSWPNFLGDFRKMGFGYVSTFPYYFTKNPDGQWSEKTQKNLAFLRQARQQGYQIVSNGSPFHIMWKKIEADQKAGKIDEAQTQEIYNQIDGKRGRWLNILYRGKYFQDEIKRVADLAALVQPDHLYLDIEWWTPVVAESKKDPRVIAAWKQSGKSWDDFVTYIGTEVLGDIVKAVRQAVPDHTIVTGLYNSDPTNKIYNSIFQWDKIYPGIVDIAQPSLYLQGRTEAVAKRIRYDYQEMQSRRIIPWLTTGTYGEFDPALVEPMVLESILNGAKGVTYYWFGDFDPMDFYYHSKALKELAPYEKLLQSGKPVEYQGDNPDLHYTAFVSANEALVLVGNYNHTSRTKVLLPLPIHATKVLLEGKPLPIKNNSVTLDVPSGQFKLIYFSR